MPRRERTRPRGVGLVGVPPLLAASGHCANASDAEEAEEANRRRRARAGDNSGEGLERAKRPSARTHALFENERPSCKLQRHTIPEVMRIHTGNEGSETSEKG